jgi:pheromone shutdown protein TraB
MEGPVLLIGAAHVVDLHEPLTRILSDRVLDAVAVELDAERAAAVLSEEEPKGSSGRSGAPIFVRMWALIQKRLGAEIGGGVAGAEMRTAADFARERSLPIFLIDDPIRETVGRLMRSMSVKERVSLMVGGLIGLVVPSRVVERQLDSYEEDPEAFLGEVRTAYPQVARVLIDERNEHMAERLGQIRHRGYGRVAAVVGDAHVPGLAGALRRRGIPVETVSLGRLRAPTAPPGASAPAP